MKHISTILWMLLFIVVTSCEKEIIDEKDETFATAEIPAVDESEKDDALTIAEAQLLENDTKVLIKAYIVASTTRSINNADFEAPFEGSSAIVLADVPANSIRDNSMLFPVCLTDRKKARAALNLVDNPQNWGHLIYIYGTKEKYMGRAGMKKVDNWEIIP